MNPRNLHVFLAALCAAAALAMAAGATPATGEKAAPTLEQVRAAAERGLAFVEQDAVKWRKEHACASCHQGAMTVWVLCEAKSLGYAVKTEVLADNVSWTKQRLTELDKPRDARPGFNMVNTQALYLAMMSLAVPTQDALSAHEIDQIAVHLVQHQEAGGNWAWSLAPLQNRPPPVFESDEVATMMGYLALGQRVPGDTSVKSDAREAREKAAAWLAKAVPSDTTQAVALRLLMKAREGKRSKGLKDEIARLLRRQQPDGGWAQEPGLACDAYATGQALYALSLAGVKPDRSEVQKGTAFLIANQREDGSWPMTPRAHPGAVPMKNPVPIVYFGSAWATMGLMRTAAK